MVKPHIAAAHAFWRHLVAPSDTVIDATCGNGHDTLLLAELVPNGQVIAFDIQPAAIEKTRERLASAGLSDRVNLRLSSHKTFPDCIPHSIKLIVYNLGYLPGGDKTLTTLVETTLLSIQNALPLLQRGGALSITLYPGHSEGQNEEKAILELIQSLDKTKWEIEHLKPNTLPTSPSVLFIRNKESL